MLLPLFLNLMTSCCGLTSDSTKGLHKVKRLPTINDRQLLAIRFLGATMTRPVLLQHVDSIAVTILIFKSCSLVLLLSQQ